MVIWKKKVIWNNLKGFKHYEKITMSASLYGLKQLLRQWYKKFDSIIEEQSLVKTTCDYCVFMQKFYDNDFIILLLYVNDMLIFGHSTSHIHKLKHELSPFHERHRANKTNS